MHFLGRCYQYKIYHIFYVEHKFSMLITFSVTTKFSYSLNFNYFNIFHKLARENKKVQLQHHNRKLEDSSTYLGKSSLACICMQLVKIAWLSNLYVLLFGQEACDGIFLPALETPASSQQLE